MGHYIVSSFRARERLGTPFKCVLFVDSCYEQIKPLSRIMGNSEKVSHWILIPRFIVRICVPQPNQFLVLTY